MGLDVIEPLACTLSPGEMQDRMACVSALTEDALRSFQRRDLTLELIYTKDAVERVRQMVHQEQTCCAFLRFSLVEREDTVLLTITAPEEARVAADVLFTQFVRAAPEQLLFATAAS